MDSTGYAPVNGLRLYYEVHGSGRPLLLLHGALSGIGTSFGELLPRLAEHRQVIAVEMQAHGRTADIDRPLRIETLAEDCVALLDHLGLERVDVFGYSIGAAVALRLGTVHTGRVRRLVLASITFHNGGLQPGLLEGIERMRPEDLVGSPFHAEYVEVAPEPQAWPTLVERVKDLDRHPPQWTEEEIHALRPPALIVIGDADLVRPEHAVEMFRLLGGATGDMFTRSAAQLAVLPGTDHIELPARAAWLAPMVEAFLAAGSAG